MVANVPAIVAVILSLNGDMARMPKPHTKYYRGLMPGVPPPGSVVQGQRVRYGQDNFPKIEKGTPVQNQLAAEIAEAARRRDKLRI